MTLVDSNVLIDFFIDDPEWSGWSIKKLQEAARIGPLLINDVIYAETSTRYQTIDEFDTALVRAGVTSVSLSRRALFLAGKAFLEYRRAGGVRMGVLSDFFIGAHALADRLPILTRDVRRYRHYFPTVELIAP